MEGYSVIHGVQSLIAAHTSLCEARSPSFPRSAK
jgi:hypothetical protein